MKYLSITLFTIYAVLSSEVVAQSSLRLLYTDDLITYELTAEDYDNDGNTCESTITLTNNTIKPLDYKCPLTLVKWDIKIDLWADGTYDLQYTHLTHPDDDAFDDSLGNGVPDIYLAPTEIGEEIQITLPEIIGNLSHHKVDWRIMDDCYNVRNASTKVLVIDRSSPTPVLKSEYSIDLSDTDNIFQPNNILHAKSLNIDSYDNCDASEELYYSFSPNILLDTLLIDCSHVSDTLRKIDVYIWDSKHNYSIAQVDVYAYDPNNIHCIICFPFIQISGRVTEIDSTPIEGAKVLITTAHPEFPRSTLTDSLGYYSFANLPQGMEYEIEVQKEDTYTPEVTLIDVVTILNHLLGTYPFESPYQYISADINNDHEINQNDILETRKIALGISNQNPTTDAWKFLPESYEFEDPTNPFYLLTEDSYKKTFFTTDNPVINFIGIKIGNLK